MSSTTNWWQQAKKSHTKLQSAARSSAPLAAANAEESSRFVDCPACGASMHRQSLNHHLDLDCPVLHGYGDHARDIDAILIAVRAHMGVLLLGVDLLMARDGRLFVVDVNHFSGAPSTVPGRRINCRSAGWRCR